MFGFSGFKRSGGDGSEILSVAAAIGLAADSKITLLDVREHGEVASTGSATGAVHIPLMMVPFHADPRHPECREELSTDKPVAVYCASGARSQSAKQALNNLGYETVYNIGGFKDWVAAGGSAGK